MIDEETNTSSNTIIAIEQMVNDQTYQRDTFNHLYINEFLEEGTNQLG